MSDDATLQPQILTCGSRSGQVSLARCRPSVAMNQPLQEQMSRAPFTNEVLGDVQIELETTYCLSPSELYETFTWTRRTRIDLPLYSTLLEEPMLL